MDSLLKVVLISIVLGIIVTLLTGFVNNTPTGLIGATWYGYPFTWLTQLSGAQGAPWTLYGGSPINLILDIALWSYQALPIVFLAMYLRVGGLKPAAAPM